MGKRGARNGWLITLFQSHIGPEELERREVLKREIAQLLSTPLLIGAELTAAERKEIRHKLKSKGRWFGGGRYFGD